MTIVTEDKGKKKRDEQIIEVSTKDGAGEGKSSAASKDEGLSLQEMERGPLLAMILDFGK